MRQEIELNDLLTTGSWGLARIIRRDAPWNVKAPRFPIQTFFDSVRDGTGVDIYLLDTGVDGTHPEFEVNVTNAWEYYSSGGVGDDTITGHGTAAASILIGKTCGVARGAQIRSMKVYASNSFTTTEACFAGLEAVVTDYNSREELGRPAVCVVNFGLYSNLETPTNAVLNAGIPIIATGHNFGNTNPLAPARYTDVIGVGGISAADLPYYLGITADATGSPQLGTPYGDWIDILAPAQAIRMADKTGHGYKNWNGNSFSTPFVGGIAACMLEGHGRFTTRAEVQAFNAKLLANATTGRLRPGFGKSPLADRIAYLDPLQTAPEPF